MSSAFDLRKTLETKKTKLQNRIKLTLEKISSKEYKTRFKSALERKKFTSAIWDKFQVIQN